MNRINANLLLVISFLLPSISFAQEPMKPSPQHEILKADVGTWDATMKLYLAGPDSKPVEFKAVETNTMLGDFWLMSSLEYDIMGQKMMGRGQFGYDPKTDKFIGTWCDSASPYISHLEGDWNEAERTFTYMMKGRDEAGNPTSGKLITKLIGDDRKTFEMYLAVPGSDDKFVKMMDVEYTQRK